MKNRMKKIWITISVGLALCVCLCSTALADTDGTEPKITRQPDQLVLQLGTRWAGVEFELRTDAGIFPVPVVVDETGILTMDLGGSKTYTLTCINSSIPIPDPIPEQDEPPPAESQPADTPTPAPSEQPEPLQTEQSGIPPLHIAVFVIGLAAGAGGLTALCLSKRRQQSAYDEWEEDEEDM